MVTDLYRARTFFVLVRRNKLPGVVAEMNAEWIICAVIDGYLKQACVKIVLRM